MIATWKFIASIFAFVISFNSWSQATLTGNWVGGAQLFGSNRFIQLRFSENNDPNQNSFDMPGANAMRLPIIGISHDNSNLSFTIESPRGDFQFKGTMSGSVASGTIEGPFNARGTLHFFKAHTANEIMLKQYGGEYLLSNDQKAYVSYNSLNSLDLVITENNSTVALKRDVKLLPKSDTEFLTARMTIASPGAVTEIVSFTFDDNHAVSGFSIKASDRPELTAKKLETNYTEEQVVINNGDIQLGGTLLLPKGKSGLTAIHTMHGAGPRLRTNTLVMLRARLMAEALGIAVLICDKRGTGHSSGSDRQPTMTEMADDAQAALKYLKSRPEINPSNVGLMAASHSGWVLPIAIQSGEASFGILVSSTPISNEVISMYEIERQLAANKFSKKDIADALAFTRLKWNYALTGTGWSEYEEAFKKSVSKKWFDMAEGPPDQERSRWEYMQLRPLEDRTIEDEIRKINVPLLLLFGSDPLDDHIPVNKSIQKWNEIFQDVNKVDYVIKSFEGTGHSVFFRQKNNEIVTCDEAFVEMKKWMVARKFLD